MGWRYFQARYNHLCKRVEAREAKRRTQAFFEQARRRNAQIQRRGARH